MRPWIPVAVGVLLPALAIAQEPSLKAGERVRMLWRPSGDSLRNFYRDHVVGTFEGVAHDTAYVSDSKHHMFVIPVTRVERIERSVGGTRGSSVGAGIMVGALAGAVVGFVLGHSDPGDLAPSDAGALAGAVFAVPGMILGGLVGAATRERWERATLPARQ